MRLRSKNYGDSAATGGAGAGDTGDGDAGAGDADAAGKEAVTGFTAGSDTPSSAGFAPGVSARFSFGSPLQSANS